MTRSSAAALEVGPPPGPAETDERLEVTLRAGLALLALGAKKRRRVGFDPRRSADVAGVGLGVAGGPRTGGGRALVQRQVRASAPPKVRHRRRGSRGRGLRSRRGGAGHCRRCRRRAADQARKSSTRARAGCGCRRRCSTTGCRRTQTSSAAPPSWAGVQRRRRRAVRHRARRVARRADRRRPAGIAGSRGRTPTPTRSCTTARLRCVRSSGARLSPTSATATSSSLA